MRWAFHEDYIVVRGAHGRFGVVREAVGRRRVVVVGGVLVIWAAKTVMRVAVEVRGKIRRGVKHVARRFGARMVQVVLPILPVPH